MVQNKKYLFILLAAFFLNACKKSDDSVPEYGYDYFPIEVGKFVIYTVTEINIDQAVSVNDTSTYFLKEKIESQFIDNQGRPSLRIERYWRVSDTLPWTIKDIWYSTRTSSIAEKTEENVRYIKLAFPVKEEQSWNGNNYNLLNEWEYSYTIIDQAASIGTLSFNKIIKVEQRNNVNFVEYEKAWEVYAEGVGLVNKRFVDLDINNGDSTDIRIGTILYQQAIAYGSE